MLLMTPFSLQLTVSLICLFICGQSRAASVTGPLDIALRSGTYRGVSTSNGTEKWLGIPFAQPPLGSLRFKAPVPLDQKLTGIQDASQFGNACPQPPSTTGTLGAAVGEDCLVLNVRMI